MNPVRREADLQALARLAKASSGALHIVALPTGASPRVELELRVPCAGDDRYPAHKRESVLIGIDLPSRYPFEPPVVKILDGPLLHPNVFESGVVCIGSRWRASEGLDLFVRRVARLLTYDPLLVNLRSIANNAAAGWYRHALRRHPQAFPSALIDWPLDTERVIQPCPACGAKLRLPAGRSGSVECPRCHQSFDAST